MIAAGNSAPGAELTGLALEQQARKALETAKAACALRGIVLVDSTDDRDRSVYVASRAALCKSFATLEDVAAWLAEPERVTQ